MKHFLFYLYISVAFMLYSPVANAQWSDPVEITTADTIDAGRGDMVIDYDSVIHVVWQSHFEGDYYFIFYSNSNDDGATWSEPEVIEQGFVEYPILDVDSDNTLYLAYKINEGTWVDNGEMLLRIYDGNTWSTPDTISGGMTQVAGMLMAIDRNNRLHALWRHTDLYYRTYQDGFWSDIQTIYDYNEQYEYIYDMAIDNNNNIHCGISYVTLTGGYHNMKAAYIKYDATMQTWDSIVIIGGNRSNGTDIALDGSQFPHMVYNKENEQTGELSIHYAYKDHNGWHEPDTVTNMKMINPRIVIDCNGNPHIFMVASGKASQLVHYQRTNNQWDSIIIDRTAPIKTLTVQNELYLSYFKTKEVNKELVCDVLFSKYFVQPNTINNYPYHDQISLKQNYPNPFSITTTIPFYVDKATNIKMQIIDLSGRLIKTIINKHLHQGMHTVKWNGKDKIGKEVKNGLYLYRLQAGRYGKTRLLQITR